jgi:hypothetical protein
MIGQSALRLCVLASIGAIAGGCERHEIVSAVAAPETAGGGSKPEPDMTTKIQITIDDTVLTGTLNGSPQAREFASMLPLTLTLTDYNRTEKVSDLPARLSRQGAPAGFDPSVGDITVFGPWGNLAIFYRDFGYSSGLIALGRIDGGSEALSGPGPVTATIEEVAD